MRFTLAIGNPPYGVGGNLAIKFLNKTAEITDDIRFVLPTSVRKPSSDRKSTRLNSSHVSESRMPSSA